MQYIYLKTIKGMIMSTYTNRTTSQQERQLQIQSVLKNNQHTFVQMNSNEFMGFMFNVQKLDGKSQTETIEWVDTILTKKQIFSKEWEQYKSAVKTGSSLIPLGKDIVLLGAVAFEMKRGGNAFSKYQIKMYNGKPNIIFKGYAGLRTQLKGTKYLTSNPKVVSFGIGKLGVANTIKGGFIMTVIISATFHSFEQLLNDKATWHDFVGGLSVDIGVAAVASGIAWGAVSTYVGGTAAMVAVGPILAVVIVGTVLTVLTSVLMDSDSLAKRVSDGLREVEQGVKEKLLKIKYEAKRIERSYDADPVGFMHRLFGIPYFGKRF